MQQGLILDHAKGVLEWRKRKTLQQKRTLPDAAELRRRMEALLNTALHYSIIGQHTSGYIEGVREAIKALDDYMVECKSSQNA